MSSLVRRGIALGALALVAGIGTYSSEYQPVRRSNILTFYVERPDETRGQAFYLGTRESRSMSLDYLSVLALVRRRTRQP